MWRATRKGLMAHKFRLVSTYVAVLLGVAFVAGTLVLSDTLQHTFDNLFTEVTKGTDVSVRSKAAFTSNDSGGSGASDREAIPASLVSTVEKVDGVKTVTGNVQGYAALIDKHGKAIIPQGPPTIGVSYSAVEGMDPLTFTAGNGPRAPNEIAIDRRTATDHGFHVGDRVSVLLQGGTKQFDLVGIFKFGSADNLAGATLTAFYPSTAQQEFNKVGKWDTIDVAAKSGVSSTELRQRIADVLPKGYEAVTGQTVADEASNQVKQGLGFFTTLLLVFAAIALFTGSFIIFNTFSIIVAQRVREMALLRALGASRRQVTRSVLAEAVVVGFVAAISGLVLGLGFAKGLTALFNAIGLDIPGGGLVLKTRTWVVSIVLGVVVTTVAALIPARKAGRIPPIAAMRETDIEPASSMRRRLVSGGLVLGFGLLLLFTGLFGSLKNGISLVGLGCMLAFIGISMLAPVVARPLAGALGRPLPRLFGTPGRLAQQNAMRNPRRTASTASALIIGLGLVGAVAVMAASIKTSVTDLVNRNIKADYVLATKSFGNFSPKLAESLNVTPGVDAASGIRVGEVQVDGTKKQLQAVDPSTIDKLIRIDMKSGEVSALGNNEVLISEKIAKDKGWKRGDTITMKFAKTGDKQFVVGGVYENNQFLGDITTGISTFEPNFSNPLDFVVVVKGAPGVSSTELRSAIDTAVKPFPNIEVRTRAEYVKYTQDQVNQMLTLVYALLMLAIIIALIGIMNTMALSVFERTREIGLARAVGMSRRQVRRMIRWESVVVSLLGAVVGLVVGVGFGWALVKALSDQGIRSLTIPVGTLVGFLVFAGVAGMGAAIFPARRAARLDVLKAIAAE